MKLDYRHTKYACYMSYICSAVVNNFAPLLFVVFQKNYGLGLDELAIIISLNFFVQMIVDFLGAKYVDKIGYRGSLIIALSAVGLGLVSMGTLPMLLSPYIGLMISVCIYAIGSGLLEVMVSPTVEALPSDAKAASMSLLHSFYCWGSVLVVVVSTLYFRFFGVDNWRILCFIWAVLPCLTIALFTKVPIIPFGKEEDRAPLKKMFSQKVFWLFALIMLSAGAAELAVSQWASLFAETGLGVSKATGDLLGPCLFAVMMGIARALYGKFGERLRVGKALIISGFICIVGYLITVFSPMPVISLLGCGVCGFGVAIMWPGTLSLATENKLSGGTALFGLLAMAGDIGCSSGPALVAAVSERYSILGSDLKAGLLCAVLFPIILVTGVMAIRIKMYKKDNFPV